MKRVAGQMLVDRSECDNDANKDGNAFHAGNFQDETKWLEKQPIKFRRDRGAISRTVFASKNFARNPSSSA